MSDSREEPAPTPPAEPEQPTAEDARAWDDIASALARIPT